MTRITPVRKWNTARKARAFAHAYGSAGRVAWVRSLPCWVQLVGPREPCSGDVQNVHTKNGGMGLKAVAATIIPLCRAHHTELHQSGRRRFEERHGMSLTLAAENVEAAWQRHQPL